MPYKDIEPSPITKHVDYDKHKAELVRSDENLVDQVLRYHLAVNELLDRYDVPDLDFDVRKRVKWVLDAWKLLTDVDRPL